MVLQHQLDALLGRIPPIQSHRKFSRFYFNRVSRGNSTLPCSFFRVRFLSGMTLELFFASSNYVDLLSGMTLQLFFCKFWNSVHFASGTWMYVLCPLLPVHFLAVMKLAVFFVLRFYSIVFLILFPAHFFSIVTLDHIFLATLRPFRKTPHDPTKIREHPILIKHDSRVFVFAILKQVRL